MCPAGGIDGSTLSASGAAKTSCKPGSSTAVAIHSSPCLSDFCKVVARGLLGGMNDKTQPPSVAYLHPSLWLQQVQPTLLPMATCIGVSTGYASAVAATEAVEAVVKPWHCPARTALRTCVSFLVTTRAAGPGSCRCCRNWRIAGKLVTASRARQSDRSPVLGIMLGSLRALQTRRKPSVAAEQ